MPTEMTGTEALAFARAYDAVDRALNSSAATRECADNALLGFKRLGMQSHGVSPGVFRDISHDIKALLARAWLRVDNAQRLLEDRMQKAKEVKRAKVKAGDIRELLDAIHRAALKSRWIDIADPRLPPAEVFLGLEDVRDFLRDYPKLEAAARALYGFSAERIRGVGAAQNDVIGWFAYEACRLTVSGTVDGRFIADLIGPVVGAQALIHDDVRKLLYVYRRKHGV
jgi:hypothetical protein